ncbi:MAG: polyisoprenoid-binding protein [Alphaproteobacteria bacterium]|nr:MAG: polyisoprenoid-binding protein [Alphaproteobacteria bacterium]
MKWYFLFVVAFLPSMALASGGAWQVEGAESSIKFSVAIEGSLTEGNFPKFEAKIQFDKEKLDQAKVEITIDLNHIEAFYGDVAANLKKKDWFDAAQFPKARFVSTAFKHLDGDKYQVAGNLSLRDVTRAETLYFTLVQYDQKQAAIKGKMVINRLNYGVGQGAWRDLSSVAGQVFLNVVIKATR